MKTFLPATFILKLPLLQRSANRIGMQQGTAIAKYSSRDRHCPCRCSKLLLIKTEIFSFRLEPIVKITLHVQQEHIASTLANVLVINALNVVPDTDLSTKLNVQARNFVVSLPHTVSFPVLYFLSCLDFISGVLRKHSLEFHG